MIMVFVLEIILFILFILYDYYRKLKFYKELINNTSKIDKAYLVLETLERPEFYDRKILYDILYEINKSMLENISLSESEKNDFKEYIEIWIHEVKIPLSAILLMIHNNKNEFDKKLMNLFLSYYGKFIPAIKK